MSERLAALAVLVAVALPAVSCGEPPEVRLRRVLEQGEKAAEQKDHARLAELVSDDYTDEQGYDRRGLLGFARAYFLQLDSVYILTRERSLVITGPGQAEVTLLVAVTSVPVDSFPDLGGMTADLARVEMRFQEEDGEWKLISADWSPADLTDFL